MTIQLALWYAGTQAVGILLALLEEKGRRAEWIVWSVGVQALVYGGFLLMSALGWWPR